MCGAKKRAELIRGFPVRMTNETVLSWQKLYTAPKQPVYALYINRARRPYEEIFVSTFKAYGPNAKYFLYGSSFRLRTAILYTYQNNYCVRALSDPYAGLYTYYRLSLSQSDRRIRCVLKSVYNNKLYLLLHSNNYIFPMIGKNCLAAYK